MVRKKLAWCRLILLSGKGSDAHFENRPHPQRCENRPWYEYHGHGGGRDVLRRIAINRPTRLKPSSKSPKTTPRKKLQAAKANQTEPI